MYHTFSKSYYALNHPHRVAKKKSVTPIAWWACTKIHRRLALPAPPPCLPSMPTHMQASTCHQQHRIRPAGWTVPIVLSLRRHRRMSSSTGCAIIVILLVLFFFSSFNDVDPSHMMLVDCCVLCCRVCGPIAAVWRRRPPWSIEFDCILPHFT